MAQMRIMVQMQISILGALRRSNVATSPASVHRLVSSSRPSLWPSALERRVSPRSAAANQHMRHVSRFLHGSPNMVSISGVKGEELGKPDMRPLNPSSKDFINSLEDKRRARVNIISGDEDECWTTLELMDSKPDRTGGNVHIAGSELCSEDEESWAAEVPGYLMDDVYPMDILPNSSHRDGTIYSGTCRWKMECRIADRNETRQEAMVFSNPKDCVIVNGTCFLHSPHQMLQIFSFKLAHIPVERGPVELYGYIAARDRLDRLLNYVINFSRNDPIVVEQGSLINMTGPKRGIQLLDTTLIEYDMKIKTGGQESEDLQLIDGVSLVDDIDTRNCRPFTAARLDSAFEATVSVCASVVSPVG